MSTQLHPFRSAPFVVPAGPPGPSGALLALVIIVAVTAIAPAYLRFDVSLRQSVQAQHDAERIASERATARAEVNARAWVRSAYGVDPWVRCDEGACDVVVGTAAPFRLACDTTPGGGCRVRGGL